MPASPTIRVLGNLFWLPGLLAVMAWEPAPGVHAQDPVVTEYDVDPAWPQRPDHVSGKGWVSGLAVDEHDQIWFFRKGPDPVQVYTTEGKFVRTWGRDQFINPHQLRIDPDGNIWVADFGAHIVQKFTPEGKHLLTLGERGVQGTDAAHFNMPTDMAITSTGDIFVTDGYGNRRVVHFTKEGQFVKTFGTAGTRPGEFVLPHAIVADSRGILYIADRNSGRIQLFDQEGKFLDLWSNVLMPWGLSITKDDELWVCGSSPHWWFRHGAYPEYKDQLFMRFSTGGRVLQHWGLRLGDIGTNKDAPDTSRLKPGETVGAHCIAQDSQGNVYVGDIYGERAQKFVPISKR
ncbi:MAG: peptidyl-alpha-hydroxyglycine alpha-amidating lyase family protein [Pirellulaceae bacterium]